MPIGNSCIYFQANACITVATTRELAQISGLFTENSVESVACVAALPSAELNKGRMIFVNDISAYRYSNGTSWTNDYDTTCSVAASSLYSWGYSSSTGGQIGDNTIIPRSSPVQEITSSTNWCQLGGGGYHSIAIKSDNTLWGWGCNHLGQLGINSTINYSSPVQEFYSETTWVCAFGGTGLTHALKNDGTFWAWGDNVYGNLGTDNIICYSSPVQEITSSTNWCTIGGAKGAIKTDGTLWTWGSNNNGQVGDGTNICRSSPVQEASSSTNWCLISGNESNTVTVGIKTNGTYWNWGYNLYGNLGINTGGGLTNSSSPVQEITSSTNWCAGNESGGIKTDGTLWTWGRGNYGNANGCCKCYSSPVQEITSSTNWCFYTQGSSNRHGLKSDGTLWSWARGSNGFHGVNDTINRSSPVQEITSSTGWSDIASSGFHVNAILDVVTGFNEP